jgi:small subunit ribosomal protein S16
MVIIRLARGGTKKRPFFHVVVTNSRSSRDGRFIERLGFFNPIATGGEIKLQLNKERIAYWVSCGAQISDRVTQLIDNFAEIVASAAKNANKIERKAVVEHKKIDGIKVESDLGNFKEEPKKEDLREDQDAEKSVE